MSALIHVKQLMFFNGAKSGALLVLDVSIHKKLTVYERKKSNRGSSEGYNFSQARFCGELSAMIGIQSHLSHSTLYRAKFILDKELPIDHSSLAFLFCSAA